MIGLEEPHGFGGFGLGVLDGLGLVEDGVVEAEVLEEDDVGAQGAVGGQDDVVVGEAFGGAEAGWPGVVEDAQRGGEARGLFAPVEDEGARATTSEATGRWTRLTMAVVADGRRDRVRRPARFEQGEDLNGFAQAHVVGEAAAEAELAEEFEPAEALLLVGAELADEVGGRLEGGDAAEGAELVAEVLEGGIDGGVGLGFQEDIEHAGLGPGEADGLLAGRHP